MNIQNMDISFTSVDTRKASFNFFLGLLISAQEEAEKLGYINLSFKLTNLGIEARYAVLDELLDMRSRNVLICEGVDKA